MIEMDSSKPIYIQIAEWLENEILEGALTTDEKVYSQYQLAEIFNINPATAGKGLTLLVDKEIIYKRRGLGMFVSGDGREKLRAERIESMLKKQVMQLIEEANRLEIDGTQLIKLIEKAYDQQGGEIK